MRNLETHLREIQAALFAKLPVDLVDQMLVGVAVTTNREKLPNGIYAGNGKLEDGAEINPEFIESVAASETEEPEPEPEINTGWR